MRCGAAGQCTPPSAGPTVTNPAPAAWLAHSSHHHQPHQQHWPLAHLTPGTLVTVEAGEVILSVLMRQWSLTVPTVAACWLLVCPRCGGVWIEARTQQRCGPSLGTRLGGGRAAAGSIQLLPTSAAAAGRHGRHSALRHREFGQQQQRRTRQLERGCSAARRVSAQLSAALSSCRGCRL